MTVHVIYMKDVCLLHIYILFILSRNELPTTETLEKAIAKPAKTGLKSQPKNGKQLLYFHSWYYYMVLAVSSGLGGKVWAFGASTKPSVGLGILLTSYGGLVLVTPVH